MSAAAGALGVELEKCGHYRLGLGERRPVPHDITRAARLVWATMFLAMIVLSFITYWVRSYHLERIWPARRHGGFTRAARRSGTGRNRRACARFRAQGDLDPGAE